MRETPQPTTRGARPLVQTGSFVLTDATQALRCCVTAWLAGGPKLFPHRAFRFIIRKRLIPPRRQGARKPTANIPGCKAALPNRFVCAYRRDGGRCVTAWLAGFANVPVLLARVRMQTAPPPPRIARFMPLPRRQGARKPTANIPGCGVVVVEWTDDIVPEPRLACSHTGETRPIKGLDRVHASDHRPSSPIQR